MGKIGLLNNAIHSDLVKVLEFRWKFSILNAIVELKCNAFLY